MRPVLRWLRRETSVVLFGAALFSVVMNWPLVRRLGSVVPHDILDPLLFSWKLAWPRYALIHGHSLWDANIFYPTPDSFAYTDSLLGYLPFSFLLGDGVEAAVARHNLVFLFACFLAFVGAYALVRQLGGVWQAAALGAGVWASAPWRLAHDNHANIIATGGIALTFFVLARGHGYSFLDGYRPERVKIGWIVTGWLLACWQMTIGFAIGIPFLYVVALLVLVCFYGWLAAGRPKLRKFALVVNGAGLIALLGVSYAMARPYLRVSERDDAARTQLEVDFFSPPVEGLLSAPDNSWAWGSITEPLRTQMAWEPEMTILMGFTVLAVAILGIFYSAWRLSVRVLLGCGLVVSGILALGTTFFGGTYSYLLLWEHLPGWDALRTPGRVIIWATLCAILLASGAITRLAARLDEVVRRDASASSNAPRLAAAVLLLPALFALVEGRPAYAYAEPIPIPAAVQREFRATSSPVLILPAAWNDARPAGWLNATFTFWTVEGFPQIVNGTSSFSPPEYREIAEGAESFPDERSIARLREHGIGVVVVLPQYLPDTPYEDALAGAPSSSLESLNVQRIDHPDAVIFRL